MPLDLRRVRLGPLLPRDAVGGVRLRLAEPVVELAPAANAAPANVAAESGRSEQARRIATLLAPLLNGLEIGQRDGAGTTLVTVVAPAISEDSVVRTAARLVGFLADARLPEPVTQATLTAAGATIVLTPFESPDAGAMLLTAVVSRASLAWLERLCRIAARETLRCRGSRSAASGARATPAGSAAPLRRAAAATSRRASDPRSPRESARARPGGTGRRRPPT